MPRNPFVCFTFDTCRRRHRVVELELAVQLVPCALAPNGTPPPRDESARPGTRAPAPEEVQQALAAHARSGLAA
eukprot:784586-Prymnesium_polylepis.1